MESIYMDNKSKLKRYKACSCEECMHEKQCWQVAFDFATTREHFRTACIVQGMALYLKKEVSNDTDSRS